MQKQTLMNVYLITLELEELFHCLLMTSDTVTRHLLMTTEIVTRQQ